MKRAISSDPPQDRQAVEAGARLGSGARAQLGGDRETVSRATVRMWHAFQLIDDVLDYSATRRRSAKSLGDDLAEGKRRCR